MSVENQDQEMTDLGKKQDEAKKASGATSSGILPKKQKIMVSANNTKEVVGGQKKNQYVVNQDMKTKCLLYLVHGHLRMFAAFKSLDSLYDLNVGMQITSHFFTLHTVLRQEANTRGTGTVSTKVAEVLTINSGGTVCAYNRDELKKELKEIAALYGLEYTMNQGANKESWWGMFGPFLTFVNVFGLRLDELRMGVQKFKVGKRGNEDLFSDISQYGLNGAHYPYLDGLSFPPAKRSAMAQSIGPLAQLIYLNLAPKGNYEDRWKTAVKRSLSHLPRVDDIISTVSTGTPGNISSLMGVIGDTLTITTGRSATRFCPPISFFFALLTKKQISDSCEKVVIEKGQPAVFIPITATGTNIEKVNFSGRGAYMLYKINQEKPFKMRWSGNLTSLQQATFHCVFGSQFEDLSLLERITSTPFQTRAEFSNAFEKKGSSNYQAFCMLKLNYYVKLSQALATKHNFGGQTQIISRPVFAGKRTVTLSDKFIQYHENHAGVQKATGSSDDVYNAILTFKNGLIENLKKTKVIQQGTVNWREMSSLSWDEDGREVDLGHISIPKLFMGDSTAKAYTG